MLLPAAQHRWNPQIYAAHGSATVMIDFHGSPGYGQAFTDAINGDWGGAPYEDLMTGLDPVLAAHPWIDPERMAALGASYGGYMINWIQGNTYRFAALVCHDGNLDEYMAYFDTEELWFPEWEHGGPPWFNPEGYRKHSPVELVKNWQTPELVVHGAQDFRVVETNGLSTFNALQRLGVPSRLLYFPDETDSPKVVSGAGDQLLFSAQNYSCGSGVFPTTDLRGSPDPVSKDRMLPLSRNCGAVRNSCSFRKSLKQIRERAVSRQNSGRTAYNLRFYRVIDVGLDCPNNSAGNRAVMPP